MEYNQDDPTIPSLQQKLVALSRDFSDAFARECAISLLKEFGDRRIVFDSPEKWNEFIAEVRQKSFLVPERTVDLLRIEISEYLLAVANVHFDIHIYSDEAIVIMLAIIQSEIKKMLP